MHDRFSWQEMNPLLRWRTGCAVLLCCAGLLSSAGVQAARPFVTDDARIVDPGGCQIETFVRKQLREAQNEFWFLPGCSPAPLRRVELTLGGFRTDADAASTMDTSIGQAKALLVPLRAGGWGMAATLGAARQPFAGGKRTNPYINLIASRAFASDGPVLHFNAGAVQDRAATRTLYTWGAGAEIPLTGRLSAIAEMYNQEAVKPSTQLGLRFWIRPDRIQVDGTFGTQAGPDMRHNWMSVGLRLLF
jgi:hypothetical protein